MTALSPGVTAPTGPLGADLLGRLTAVRLEQGVNLVGRATLRFDDDGYRLSAGSWFAIGGQLEVTAPGQKTPLFTGIVTAVALEHSAHHVPELVVTAHEPTHQMTSCAPPRTFESQPLLRTLETLVKAVNLEVDVAPGALPADEVPYLLQTGTALALLDEVVRGHGAMWSFEAPDRIRVDPVGRSGPEVKLEFAEPGDTTGTKTLLTFSVRATGGTPQAAHVRGWNPVLKEAIKGKFEGSPENAESEFARPVVEQSWPAVTSTAGSPNTAAEADARATALLASARSDAVSGRGTALVDGRIRPGVAVAIGGAGPASGSYWITRVEHAYDRRGFHTTFHTGSHRPRGLVDTLGNGNGVADTRIDGVLIGIVTALNDPETLGRVRVKFPVMVSAEGTEIVSAWARVATFDAGSGRGATFLPEIEDEVVVAFENGDLRNPLILGAVFGGKNKPPDLETLLEQENKVRSRRMTSRTGHVFEMVDEKSKGQILLKHGTKPLSMTFDEATSGIKIEATNGEIELTNGKASIRIDKSGKVTIEGMGVEIKSKQDLTVEAQTNATIKSTAAMAVEGMTLSAKGTTTALVQGGTSAAIKGGSVMIN